MSEKPIQITKFDYGISGSDNRNLPDGLFDYLENVNAGEKTKGLKQLNDVSGVDSTRTLLKVINVSNVIYGLGKSSSGNNFALYRSIDYGATFTEITPTSTSTFFQVENPFLVHYQGYVYFFNGTYIARYATNDGDNDGNWLTLSLGGDAFSGGIQWQGKLWGWHNNDIYYVLTSGSKVQMNAIPADQSIIDLIPYGNLLSSICTSTGSISNMYLIDGVSTTTFTDIVPIGFGYVSGGCIINGMIKAIISTGFGGGYGFEIKYYDVGGFKTEYIYKGKENLSGDKFVYLISRVKVYGNFMYFIIGGTRPNTTTTTNSFSTQLMRYGSKVQGEKNLLVVYKDLNFIPSNITRASDKQNDFVLMDLRADAYSIFATIQDNASTPTIKEIMTTTTKTQAGVLETSWYDGDYASKKIFKGFMCQFLPLPTGASVVLKYKKNAETTWTTLFTEDTDNEIQRELIKDIQAKQIKVRIELTGGAELTGFLTKYETQSSKLL